MRERLQRDRREDHHDETENAVEPGRAAEERPPYDDRERKKHTARHGNQVGADIEDLKARRDRREGPPQATPQPLAGYSVVPPG